MSYETDGILLLNRKNLKVLHMYRAGLGSNVSKEYQKNSLDFILVGMIDRELFSAAVEIKACCSKLIAAKERRRLNSKRQYSYISYYSDDLRKHVLKKLEAVQVSIYLLFI